MGLVNQNRLRRILTRMLDENEFLSPYGIRSLVPLSRRASLRLFGGRSGISGELSAGGVGQRHVWRQLQLAGSDLDAGQRADHPRPDALLCLLRRQLQNRVPDRLRQLDEPVRGRARDHQSPDPDLSARRERTAAGVWRRREIPERSSLAGQFAVLRILPWRQRRRDRRQPPDGMDRGRRRPDRDFRQARCRDLSEGGREAAFSREKETA